MEGGPLGITLIVMTLTWWLKAVGDDEKIFGSTRLADAITDMTWVLDQLASTLSDMETPTAVKPTEPASKVGSKPKSKCNRSPLRMDDEPLSKQ